MQVPSLEKEVVAPPPLISQKLEVDKGIPPPPPLPSSGGTSSERSHASSGLAPIPYDPKVMAFIHDDWICKQLKLREREFTQYSTRRVFVGSWNINAKKSEEDLSTWLFPSSMHSADQQAAVSTNSGSKKSLQSELPDIYVVGFQEMVDLNAANVAFDAQCQSVKAFWDNRLLQALNSHRLPRSCGVQYTHVTSKHLVGILISVFVKKRHQSHVTDVQGTTAAVGIMGVIGNKGAASVSLKFYDSSFCFVCAHLAAHRNNVASRNANFRSILEKTSFKDFSNSDITYSNRSKQIGRSTSTPPTTTTTQQASSSSFVSSVNNNHNNNTSGGGVVKSSNIVTVNNAFVNNGQREDSNQPRTVHPQPPAIQQRTSSIGPPPIPGPPPLQQSTTMPYTVAAAENINRVSGLSAASSASSSKSSFSEAFDQGHTGSRRESTTGVSLADHSHTSHNHQRGTIGILEHDYAWFFGDLNYRINSTVSLEECYKRIAAGKDDKNGLPWLACHDQLNEQRVRHLCFDENDGWCEAGYIAAFNPTYKYIAGTSSYDNRPEKKQRVPAWCDRILYRVNREEDDSLSRSTMVNTGLSSNSTGEVSTVKNVTAASHDKSGSGLTHENEETTFIRAKDPNMQAMLLSSSAITSGDNGGKLDMKSPSFSTTASKLPVPEGQAHITPLLYERAEQRASDHKPVMAVLSVGVKVIIQERRKHIFKDIMRQLDYWENECMPKLDVSSNVVVFKDVRFRHLAIPVTKTNTLEGEGITVTKTNKSSSSSSGLATDNIASDKGINASTTPIHATSNKNMTGGITLYNSGQVKAAFRFVPKLEEQSFAKSWLRVYPPYGILFPGERVVIRMEVLIDEAAAARLNVGQDKLDDILILRLEHGRDYFIAVSGNYLKSCFGCSLTFLCRSPGPIRDIPNLGTALGSKKGGSTENKGVQVVSTSAQALSIPKEIWRVVDAIYQSKAMLVPGIFYNEGNVDEMLPRAHRNTFIYILSFLREVLKHSHINGLEPDSLASVFVNCLFWLNEEEIEKRQGK
eukprot:g992.t1